MFQHVAAHVALVRDVLWGLPLLCFIASVAVLVTYSLQAIQFTGFLQGCKSIFMEKAAGVSKAISPLQAFLKALSTSLGNGAIAGVATAIAIGGPGAVFWIFMFGFLGMILRFCEVMLATHFSSSGEAGVLGGPFAYLQHVPGRRYLPHLYAVLCLGYGLFSGNAMQCNSIAVAITSMSPFASSGVIGIILMLFMVYVIFGGKKRILAANSIIVPVKVVLFFVTGTGVLLYHWAKIPQAVALIFQHAFLPQAFIGGTFGGAMIMVLRYSLARAINASESGLGTAAVIYGATNKSNPLRSGLSAMIGTFISINLVATMVGLAIVVSGVLPTGLTSAALTSAAFQTAFGSFGAWAVSLLAVTFGVGVCVAYSFVARECWMFLTKDRFEYLFIIIFTIITYWGSVSSVKIVWDLVDLVNAGLIIINLYAVVYLLPTLKKITFKK